jgi:secreted trypsin-like serine protease
MKSNLLSLKLAFALIWALVPAFLRAQEKTFASFDELIKKSDQIREKVGGDLDQALKSASEGKTLKEKLNLLSTALKGTQRAQIGFAKFDDFDKTPVKISANSIYKDPEYQVNVTKIAVDGVSGRAFGPEAIPTRKKEFPECVALGRAGDYSASGVIIDNDLILTAAHICAGDPESVPDMVWYGTITSNCDEAPKKGIYLRVTRYFRHQDYKSNGSYENPKGNDLMLLEIHPDDRNKIDVTAQMATDEEVANFGKDPLVAVRAVGFGHCRKDEQGRLKGFGVRRHVTIPLASRNVSLYDLFQVQQNEQSIVTEFVAASKSELADTCKGDSGGPVYIISGPVDNRSFKLIGITSRATPGFANQCGDGGIYEFLPVYRDWIQKAYQDRANWMSVE